MCSLRRENAEVWSPARVTRIKVRMAVLKGGRVGNPVSEHFSLPRSRA